MDKPLHSPRNGSRPARDEPSPSVIGHTGDFERPQSSASLSWPAVCWSGSCRSSASGLKASRQPGPITSTARLVTIAARRRVQNVRGRRSPEPIEHACAQATGFS
jgi:hypothetical protein